jgi:hypothetical protein
MDWYERNRARICAKKRELYHNNPELKEKKKAQALARYYRLKTDATPSNIFSNQDKNDESGAPSEVDGSRVHQETLA